MREGERESEIWMDNGVGAKKTNSRDAIPY